MIVGLGTGVFHERRRGRDGKGGGEKEEMVVGSAPLYTMKASMISVLGFCINRTEYKYTRRRCGQRTAHGIKSPHARKVLVHPDPLT